MRFKLVAVSPPNPSIAFTSPPAQKNRLDAVSITALTELSVSQRAAVEASSVAIRPFKQLGPSVCRMALTLERKGA